METQKYNTTLEAFLKNDRVVKKYHIRLKRSHISVTTKENITIILEEFSRELLRAAENDGNILYSAKRAKDLSLKRKYSGSETIGKISSVGYSGYEPVEGMPVDNIILSWKRFIELGKPRYLKGDYVIHG